MECIKSSEDIMDILGQLSIHKLDRKDSSNRKKYWIHGGSNISFKLKIQPIQTLIFTNEDQSDWLVFMEASEQVRISGLFEDSTLVNQLSFYSETRVGSSLSSYLDGLKKNSITNPLRRQLPRHGVIRSVACCGGAVGGSGVGSSSGISSGGGVGIAGIGIAGSGIVGSGIAGGSGIVGGYIVTSPIVIENPPVSSLQLDELDLPLDPNLFVELEEDVFTSPIISSTISTTFHNNTLSTNSGDTESLIEMDSELTQSSRRGREEFEEDGETDAWIAIWKAIE